MPPPICLVQFSMTSDTIRLLNRLLALHCRSFAQYLQYSCPHVPPGREAAVTVVESVARDQEAMAQRISGLLAEAGALARTGEFPMDFTDSHDLGIDYVLNEAIHCQAEDVRSIEGIVRQLAAAPAAKAAAEEALGMAKGHLESLKEAAEGSAYAV